MPSAGSIAAEGGALSLPELQGLGPYAEAYGQAMTPDVMALLEMARLEETGELADQAWQQGLETAQAQATGETPLFSSASEYIQGRLGGPAREIPNAFTGEIANLIGGESADALAAQYGGDETRIHDAYKKGAISEQEYQRHMRKMERDRAGAMMSAYRDPAIAQAEASQRLGIAGQELDVRERQGLLGAASGLYGAQTSALSTLGRYTTSMPGGDTSSMMAQLAEAASARRQVSTGSAAGGYGPSSGAGKFVRGEDYGLGSGTVWASSGPATGAQQKRTESLRWTGQAGPMTTGSMLSGFGVGGLSDEARLSSNLARFAAETGPVSKRGKGGVPNFLPPALNPWDPQGRPLVPGLPAQPQRRRRPPAERGIGLGPARPEALPGMARPRRAG